MAHERELQNDGRKVSRGEVTALLMIEAACSLKGPLLNYVDYFFFGRGDL